MHSASAWMLGRALFDHDPLYGRLIALNSGLNPATLGDLSLVFLTRFLPPPAAEKVLVSCYALLGFGLFWAAIRLSNPKNTWISLLAVPVFLTFAVHEGLYSYCLGIVVYLMVWVFKARGGFPLTAKGCAILCAVLTAGFFAHLMTWGLAIAATFFCLLQRMPVERRMRQLLLFGAAALPSAVLSAVYIIASRQHGEPTFFSGSSFDAWMTYVSLRLFLFWEDRFTDVFSACLTGVLFFLSFLRVAAAVESKRVFPSAAGWMVMTALVLPFILPVSAMGHDLVIDRLPIFLVLSFLLWLAEGQWSKAVRRTCAAASAALSISLAWALHSQYQVLQPAIREYVSVGAHLKPGQSVLPIGYAARGEPTFPGQVSFWYNPLFHAWGYLVFDHQIIPIENLLADPVAHSLYRYRSPHMTQYISANYFQIPFFNLSSIEEYEKASGEKIDWLLLYRRSRLSEDKNQQLDAPAPELFGKGWREVYVSEPTGLARLYTRSEDKKRVNLN